MIENPYDITGVDVAWCPGCGLHSLHRLIKQSLTELEIPPRDVVMVSGIGQAAKLPHYVQTNWFDGLHGRALPAALAIKAANPDLKVIVVSGDGCSYAEGGNHFMHQILRNPGITHIVSDNQVYGLTKGQASPTSLKGMVTPVQVSGVTNEPFNPLVVAIGLGATFVARIYVGDADKSKVILKQALQHKGYALVDSFSPCVSFNKLNSYQWYKEHTYYIDDAHDAKNQPAAFTRAIEADPWPLGVFYNVEGKPTFEEQLAPYKTSADALYKRQVDMQKLKSLIEAKRSI